MKQEFDHFQKKLNGRFLLENKHSAQFLDKSGCDPEPCRLPMARNLLNQWLSSCVAALAVEREAIATRWNPGARDERTDNYGIAVGVCLGSSHPIRALTALN